MNKEYDFVSSLIEPYPKTRGQLTKPFESDGEVVKSKSSYLCISQDTVCEEITLGLIRHPTTLGWLTVICSVSDLAATGVAADNLSIAVGLPKTLTKSFERLFLAGVREAASYSESDIIELNFFPSDTLITTCTAFSTRSQPPPLTRLGLQPGDIIYSTGPVGWGNTVALLNVMRDRFDPMTVDRIDAEYRPLPRYKEALFINKWARSCIDSSDGALFSLSLLSDLNHIGIAFHLEPNIFHPLALRIAQQAGLPPWLFFAAQNGEFELIFSIPKERVPEFCSQCAIHGYNFLRLGHVTETPGLHLIRQREQISLDLSSIQNMLYEGNGPEQYVLGLLNYYQQFLKD